MTPRLLILTDPFGKPAYAPRLRFLCDYLTAKGWELEVYTEQFEPHDFPHAYPIYEVPVYHGKTDWIIKSIWSLLTDWRNRRFSRIVRQLTADKHYDLVFCTTFSTFPLRAAIDVAKAKHIPMVADLRDVDEQVPGAQYQSHRQWYFRPFRSWYRAVNIRRRNHVLKQADAITTVSPWHVQFLQQLNRNVHLVYNGYDPNQFYAEDIAVPRCMVTYIGRLYEFQDITPVEKAIQELHLPDMHLNLHLPDCHPLPITQVGDEIRRSSVMVVLTNREAKGLMTTKFYEALGCEKPVLCIPDDHGVLAETIRRTNAGTATSDIEHIKQFLLDKYEEWQRNGFTRQPVRDKAFFSRRTQAERMETLLTRTMQTDAPLLTDICWTLYRSNTTFDFMDRQITSSHYKRMRRIMHKPPFRWLNLLFTKLFHYDLERAMALRFLCSLSPMQRQEQADVFRDQFLNERRIPETWSLLENRRVILVSGTLDVIAHAVAKEVHPEAVFAGCLVKNNVMDRYPVFDIITDNHADLPLIRKARKACIVVYDDEAWWHRHTDRLNNIRFIHVRGTKY